MDGFVRAPSSCITGWAFFRPTTQWGHSTFAHTRPHQNSARNACRSRIHGIAHSAAPRRTQRFEQFITGPTAVSRLTLWKSWSSSKSAWSCIRRRSCACNLSASTSPYLTADIRRDLPQSTTKHPTLSQCDIKGEVEDHTNDDKQEERN